MSLWLINHFSLWQLTSLFIGGIVAVSVGLCYLIRRRKPEVPDGDINDVAGVILGIFGAIYGIVLAFVIVVLWEQYGSSQALVTDESTAMAQMVRASRAFPPEIQFHMREAAQEYVQAVVDDEWSTMKEGKNSPRTAAAIDNLYSTLQGYAPETASQEAFYRDATTSLQHVASTRRARLEQSRQGLPVLFQILVFGGAVVVIALTLALGIDRTAIQLAFVGLVASLVGFNLLLTVVMDYPFAGGMAIGNEPFKEEVLAQFWAVKDGGEPVVGDRSKTVTSQEMVGVWNSVDFGVIAFRAEASRVKGVYRYDGGAVTGEVQDGVFFGWWCEAPARKAPAQAGIVEFRLVETADGQVLDGKWKYGDEGNYKESWDMRRVIGPEPADLRLRFGKDEEFCERP